MRPDQWKSYVQSIVVLGVLGLLVVINSPSHLRSTTEIFVVASGLLSVTIGLFRARKYQPTGKIIERGEAKESVGLRSDERAFYHRRVTNPLLLLFSLSLLALCFYSGITPIMLIGGLGWLYIIGGVSIVDVRIDSRGVLVSAWPLRVPRRFIPVEKIKGARSITVRRTRLWGLRWLARDRSWAFLIRGREALEVLKDNGEALVVTIPDSITAAGLVNDLRSRPSLNT